MKILNGNPENLSITHSLKGNSLFFRLAKLTALALSFVKAGSDSSDYMRSCSPGSIPFNVDLNTGDKIPVPEGFEFVPGSDSCIREKKHSSDHTTDNSTQATTDAVQQSTTQNPTTVDIVDDTVDIVDEPFEASCSNKRRAGAAAAFLLTIVNRFRG